ncbi:apolipoprotein N-acyltransferase [Cellulomonas sp. ES6]|uniref:apolipoprotein N-acyltransferase n=1 Tax=Cellulomonas sp. ES6 TaxID=3039384 RepID=UPI0024B68AC9|nr:apolipoprotein N-acyltransferase [Cellulomonas sp. ES6]WHP16501.1 apolipoprotein N-acyltransferase [Cellulomonas sp. ES6]
MRWLGAAAAGGLITAAAFPDLGWWPAALVGVALLAAHREVESVRAVTARWFVWGLSFFLVHVSWAQQAAGAVAWFALATVESILVAAVGAAWAAARRARWVTSRTTVQAVVFASVWVAGEQLRAVWPFGGFPWGRLAFSQTDGPLLGLAWLGGAPLVSFAVALIAYLLTATLTAWRRGEVRTGVWLTALAAAAVLVGPAVPLDTSAQAGTLRVGVVQGNVPEPGTDGAARAWRVLTNHVEGTKSLATQPGAEPVDLVIWPENATDIDPRQDPRAAALVQEGAAAINAPILVGTDRDTPAGRYNDMVVWDPRRGPLTSYSKQQPAAFGEYVPLRALVRVFSPEVDRVSIDMIPGTKPGVLSVPAPRLHRDIPAATAICFEVAYDNLVRDAVVRGGQFIAVPTNNASFGRSPQSTQQLAMSRLRAVEHGRAVIQASTVGVSAVIAPDGTMNLRTSLFTAETLTAQIPLRTALSPADRARDAPVAVATVAALIAVGSGVVTSRRRRPPVHPSRPGTVALRLFWRSFSRPRWRLVVGHRHGVSVSS